MVVIMATKQSLKGGTSKIYEIINTFNKGYNTAVADDLLSENVFRDITNFLPSTEGNVTKRPGIHRTNIYEFFKSLLDNDPTDFTLNVKGNYNSNTSDNLLSRKDLTYLFDNLFELSEYKYTRNDTINKEKVDVSCSFTPESLANLTILDDNGDILDNLSNFKDILDFEKYDSLYKNGSNLDFLVILYGNYTETYNDTSILLETNAIRLIKVSIKLSKDTNYIVSINYEIRNPYRTSKDNRLSFRYNSDELIDFAIYANNYYFMNGYDAIIKISREINPETSSDSIVETYKDSTNIYKPTAIEVTNIGFNILSSKPLEYVDVQGTVDAIRGVFYTYEGEPTQILPYNKEFKLHLLTSGTGTVQTPKYRPNNGEVDEDVNPYKELEGSFNSAKTIFTCTGLNETTNLELKFQKGEDTFLAYVTMGSVETKTTGKISDISDLVLSSKYCKVINNQLAVYGNHGYIFFSEYDNFEYFPNYNNIYVAETENESVVSINYFRQYYAIFTNRRIKRMTGSFGADDFGIYPLNDFIGCINPKSIKQIQNYLYFLSYNGLYILKQGYLGEGTENVEQIDLPIYNSYDPSKMLKAYTVQNYYALFSKSESLMYNFTNEAFYKLKTADVNAEETSTLNVNETNYSVPFQYNKIQNILLYGIKIKNEENIFDICYQDFSEQETERTDNDLTFVSTLETPAMSLGTPTNTKKFKEIYIKLYNSYGKNIPLYVTIKVDDKVVVSPSNYAIKYDEDTNTYYYVEEIESNKELKGYNVLGTLVLGEDPVGERTMQILKMRVGSKGRSIKIILSDGINQGEPGYSPKQNMYRFDVSTLGIVYKLKKVKEG
jgi:hypothetical protein